MECATEEPTTCGVSHLKRSGDGWKVSNSEVSYDLPPPEEEAIELRSVWKEAFHTLPTNSSPPLLGSSLSSGAA